MSLQLRVRTDLPTPQDIALPITVRIYEFSVGVNPDVAPGGQAIVAEVWGGTGWVHGCITGRGDTREDGSSVGVYINRRGILLVGSNDPVGLFVQLESGHGTLHNIAALTGQTMTYRMKAIAIYQFGTSQRVVTGTDLICDAHDGAAATFTPNCTMLITSDHVVGTSNMTLEVAYKGTVASCQIQIFAPRLPLDIALSATQLRGFRVGIEEPLLDNSCRSRIQSASLAVRTSFTNTMTESAVVDVTALISNRLESTNRSVAVVDPDGETVTGIGDGRSTIQVSGTHNEGTAVEVNSSDHLDFRRLLIAHYSELKSTILSNGSLRFELKTDRMIQTGPAGSHPLALLAEFQNLESAETFYEAVSPMVDVVFSSTPNEIVHVANNMTQNEFPSLIADGTGTANVSATWYTPCSTVLVSGSTVAYVEIPEPRSVWISDGNNISPLTSFTVAHDSDPASVSGAVSRHSQSVTLVIDYGEYQELVTSTTDTRVVVGQPGDTEPPPITVGECPDQAGFCIFPIIGMSGTTQISIYLGQSVPTNESHIAKATVTVVQASALYLQLHPHPGDNSVGLSAVTLRPYGDPDQTMLFEHVKFTVRLNLSDGRSIDVSDHEDLRVEVNDTSLIHIVSFDVRVRASRPNASADGLVVGTFPDLTTTPPSTLSSAATVSVDISTNPVSSIFDVTLCSSVSDRQSLGSPPTLHKTRGSTYAVVFSVIFSDGNTIPSSAMGIGYFGSEFLRAGLFTFSSSDTVAAPVDNGGMISLHENGIEPVQITISANADPTINGTTAEHYTNLRAGPYEVDIASDVTSISQGPPVTSSTGGNRVELEIYLTTGPTPLGAVEMVLTFNASVYSFGAARGGIDFDQNFGADGSSTVGEVRFGGVTTDYLSGQNLHVATVSFDLIDHNAGVTYFSGEVLSLADQDGNGRNLPQVPFSFGRVGTVAVWHGSGRRRSGKFPSNHLYVSPATFPSRRKQRSLHCVAGVGPFPVGDVSGDCFFDTTDALITAQYVLISSNGDAAEDMFFSQRRETGIIQGEQGSDAMDVDHNHQVMVSDVQHMM